MSRVKPAHKSDNTLPLAQDISPDRAPPSPMSAVIEGFSAEIRNLERCYSELLETAAHNLEETVRGDVTARLREEFDQKLETGISMIREQLERKLSASIAAWEAERRRLVEENEELRRLADIDTLREEIEGTETALAEITGEVAAMVENPNVKLADVMRKNTEQNDQRAYLRGLRFRASVDELDYEE